MPTMQPKSDDCAAHHKLELNCERAVWCHGELGRLERRAHTLEAGGQSLVREEAVNKEVCTVGAGCSVRCEQALVAAAACDCHT